MKPVDDGVRTSSHLRSRIFNQSLATLRAVDAIISHDEPAWPFQMAVGHSHPINAVRLNHLLNSIRPVVALFFHGGTTLSFSYTQQSHYVLEGHAVTPSAQVAALLQFALCIDFVEEALRSSLALESMAL